MKRETSPHLWASRAAGGSGRSGMTLIEILIAMGIFTIGVMGILTLFPVAIRNVSVAVNRTMGAAVAKNAIASIRLYAIDLSVAPGVYATIGTPSFITLDGRSGVSFSHAIRDYHRHATKGRYLGQGVYHDSFKIPGDVTLPASLSGGGGGYVAVPWHQDMGWTATLRPTPKDGDGDGVADEDPKGVDKFDVDHEFVDDDGDDPGDGTLTDEDEPNIDDDTVYQAQIAVWRNYALVASAGVTADFGNDSRTVDIAHGGDTDLWNKVKPGDYIRHVGHGVWYQIAQVLPGAGLADGQIVLSEKFSHPFAAPLSGPIELANRFRLVALYDTVVGP